MLRIINQPNEAKTELQRICARTHDDHIFNKEATVREVLQAVKRKGDHALLQYTSEFDQVALTAKELRIGGTELDAAYQQVSKGLLDAIRLACQNIEAFHRQRLPKSWVQFHDNRVELAKR